MTKRPEHKDLLPDRTLTVTTPKGEETVEVRAFRFADYFEVQPLCRPILDELGALTLDVDADTESLIDQVRAVFARHPDALREVVARSVGRSQAWVEALDAVQAKRLFYLFLDANHAFFFDELEERRTLLAMVARILRQVLSPSPPSSRNSSGRASAAAPRRSRAG